MSAYTNAHPAALGAYPPGDGREWVVLLTPDTRRMMSTFEVQAEVSAGMLSRETLVWRAGMSEWMAIARIGELDVPSARQQHVAPSASWQGPVAAHSHPAGQGHARPHTLAQRPASNAELTQELVAAGAVAVIVVAVTLYMLSLGGAFAPGRAHHPAPGASSSAQPSAHGSSA